MEVGGWKAKVKRQKSTKDSWRLDCFDGVGDFGGLGGDGLFLLFFEEAVLEEEDDDDADGDGCVGDVEDGTEEFEVFAVPEGEP